MEYEYRLFSSSDIGQLYQAFVEAFSDYYVNFQPNLSQFYHRIFHKLNISTEISGLVCKKKGDVLGFIMHTLNDYAGKRTAYNGGTGIIPGFRQKNLMSGLYEMILEKIKEKGAEGILLEVISDNKPAIGFYQSLGFEQTRIFRCFKTYEIFKVKPVPNLTIKRGFQLKPAYEDMWDFMPAFLDNTPQLAYNFKNEIILEAYWSGLLAGYIIFQPAVGRTSQIAVGKDFRELGVGALLLQAAQALSREKCMTLMNIPDSQTDTIARLEKMGFKNEVTQCEMQLVL